MKTILSPATQDKAAVLLAKGLIAKSIPINFVDDPNIKSLFDLLGVRKLSSRKYLSDSVIPQVYSLIEKEQRKRLKTGKNITVISDGWTDCSGINYVAVMLKVFYGASVKYEYIGNLDLEGKHTGLNLATSSIDFLKSAINNSNIVAVVSDSAANMIAMKKHFTDIITTAFEIPCVLHVLNLVAKDILKLEELKVMSRPVIELASFFNRSYFYSNQLKKWGAESNVRAGKMLTFCVTRWTGFYDCCASVLKYEAFFSKSKFLAKEMAGLPNHIQQILKDDYFFTNVKFLMDIFEPLCLAIKILERDHSSIAEVLPQIIKIHNLYSNKLKTSGRNRIPIYEGILLILNRRSQIFLDGQLPFLVGFCLNPRYRTQSLSETFTVDKYKEMIVEIIQKMEIFKIICY